jgi:hypothetical protein
MRRRWLSCRRSSGQVERRRRPRRMQAVLAAGFARLYAVYKNYLARPKCSHRAGLVLDVPEQCCGVCLSTLTDRGSASCSLVLTIAGTILDRGRNARARPTSISRPLCGVQEFLAATAGARAIPCRTPSAPSSPDGTPWVRRQNQRGAERSETSRQRCPPFAVSILGAAPGCSPKRWRKLRKLPEWVCRLRRNRGYRRAVANVSATSVFSPHHFKDLAASTRSSSGRAPGVIALSHHRNRTVTCGS